MGEVMTPLPKTDPRMIAWELYRQTSEYANSLAWAADPEHRNGSMWAVFEAGWMAGNHHRGSHVPPPVPNDDRPNCGP